MRKTTRTIAVPRLIAWMNEEDVTQEELADRLGGRSYGRISRAAVSQWLRAVARPTAHYRHALALLTQGKVREEDWETVEEKKWHTPLGKRA